MGKYADVIISINHKDVDRIFQYAVPDELEAAVTLGMRVLVPFGGGNKRYEGYVIGLADDTQYPKDKIKAVLAILDGFPVFTDAMLQLAKWMKEKYYTTLADCLQCIMPTGIALKNNIAVKDFTIRKKYAYINEQKDNFEQLVREIISKNNQQSRVLELLMQENGLLLNEIKMSLGISSSPISTLEKNGFIRIEEVETRRDVIDRNISAQPEIVLNGEQEQAVAHLKDMLYDEHKKPVLIHGVTGSGKTEIYMQLIEEVMKNGKQAIMLVPEIALTPQAIEVFTNRFAQNVTVTHSRLSLGERFDQWKKALDGQVSVMIGPRSAIFTPFKNLGIIIIDEEHENTYKSETSPKYYVKEVAEKLGEITGALVVLGSATPSVSTYYEAQTGRLSLCVLKERVNKQLPEIEVVDMRYELAMGNRSIFSTALYAAIAQNLKLNQQTILFMNRRGHSTFVSCRACGYVMGCEQCSVNYTYHFYNDKLMCHYCGHEEESPENCPICGSKHIRFFGAGTQKIEEEIKAAFPAAVAIRMDMDTTGRKNSHASIIKQFADGRANILIGTQMIAKGLNFPNVSLVGIIAADTALNTGDFRSAETAYQLITQVSGRAGRAQILGKVFIQTYNPEHYSIIYAKDNNYEKFYEHEISIRRQMCYPPFSNIFVFLFTGTDEKKIIKALHKLLEIMKFYNRKGLFEMLGPAPCIVSKIKKNYRWKLLVKCADEGKIKSFAFYCMDKLTQSEDTSGISFNLTLNPKMIM